MSRSLKSFMIVSCLFALFFISSNFNKLEAADGRWSAYNNERPAWGGNGGWWGDGHSDWYGEYGWPESKNYYGGYYNPYYGGDEAYNYNGYYYDNNYPYYGQYNYGNGPDYGQYNYGNVPDYGQYNYGNGPDYGQYYYGNGPGLGAGADVDGAGLYFNVR
jgi:hypothetical protein